MYLKPEKGWEDNLREVTSVSPPQNTSSPPDWVEDVISYEAYLSFFGATTANTARKSSEQVGKGWMRCAKIRTPKAYQEVYDALMRIEMDMPPERRTNWETWDGNVQDWHFGSTARRELAVLVGSSKAHAEALEAYGSTFSSVARGCSSLMCFRSTRQMNLLLA